MTETTLETLTRSQFEALVDSIIRAIATPETNGDKAFDTLKSQFGITERPTSELAHLGENSTRWEHPLIAQHNTRQGSRGILNQGFFTLYASTYDHEEYRYKYRGFHGELVEHVTPAHTTGYVEFCVGRIGNTYSVGKEYNIISDPPVQADDRQGGLFGEVE